METSPCCNSVASHQIATNFCICHDSTAVVPCTKFCSYHCIWIEMRVKRNLHRIWIAMEKTLVKRDQSIYSVQPWGVSGAVYCAVCNHQCHRDHWGRRGWSDHHIATLWVTICAYETTIADAFQNHKNCYLVNQIWKWEQTEIWKSRTNYHPKFPIALKFHYIFGWISPIKVNDRLMTNELPELTC